MSKLEKLIDYLLKNKYTLPTMISSLKRFHTYSEINGGILADNTMRADSEALSLALEAQPAHPVVSI